MYVWSFIGQKHFLLERVKNYELARPPPLWIGRMDITWFILTSLTRADVCVLIPNESRSESLSDSLTAGSFSRSLSFFKGPVCEFWLAADYWSRLSAEERASRGIQTINH